MKRTSFTFILSVCTVLICNAQRDMGIATSNWSGTNSIYLNPANIADSKLKFTIDLFSLNFGIDNNLASLNTGSALKNFFKGDSTGIKSVFNFSGRQNFSLLAPYGEVRGPGCMVSIDSKNSIAITTRIRAFNQFNNFSQDLYRYITDSNYNNGVNYTVASSKFNWTAQLWSEIGATYARVLLDNKTNLLKAGVTLRYLGGIAYIGVKGNNLNATYNSSVDSLQVNHTDVEYASNIVNSQNQLSNGIGNADLLSSFLGAKGGSGIGGDIGFVYEYRPGKDGEYDGGSAFKIPYMLRFSAAVTDIGAINYKHDNFTANFSGNGNLTSSGLSNVSNYNDFRTYAIQQGFKVDTSDGSTKVHMPTALVLAADYNIGWNAYVNVTFIGNLANRQNFGNSYYSQITITPRYDIRFFSIGVPITYSWLSQGIEAGLGIRLGGFFFGSDDALAFLSHNQYGLNFYFGGYVPLNKKKHKDKS